MASILEIQNLSKKYKIQHVAGGYLSLRERLLRGFMPNPTSNVDFYALRDVSFDVRPNESVGIIGRNGAGKSTLLKILSKITPPTKGRIVTRGRIASLLEVGTGFHPELTGRENIFFNGSLLGMKKREIQSRFDAIVDFSGTEMFLDTPLKHYSSGMQLRLAFSVAAFLEPEILIIDEVLAVGDAEFQKKCLGKMEDVSKSGRTILFVSHNISSLKYLCTRGILLDKGKKSFDGPIDESIRRYLNIGNNEKSTDRLADPSLHHGTGEIFVDRIEVKTTSGPRIAHTGDTVHFCLSYEIRNKDFDFTACHVGIIIYDQNQNVLISHTNKLIGVHFSNRDFTSGNCIVFSIENLPLMKGPYSLSYNIVDQNKYLDSMENAFEFEVEEGLVYNYTMMNAGGILAVKGNWGIQKV